MSFIDFISGKKSKMKKEEDLNNVTAWHLRLKELGEYVSIEELLEISKSGKNIKKHSMAYKSIFSTNEFYSFIEKTFPKNIKIDSIVKNYMMETYYKVGFFSNDSLELVVRSKKLSKEIDKYKEGIRILERKEKGSGLSNEARTELKGLKNQKEHMEKELSSILELQIFEHEYGVKYSIGLHFNTSVLKSEEEILGMVKEVMKPEEKNRLISGTESLPIKEMKEFLDTNRLPDDVTKELNETIDLIDSYLKSNKEEDDAKELRMKAKVLVKSAKDYHNIAQ